MNYKVNHPTHWVPSALGLTETQEEKIDKALADALNKIERNGKSDFSFDEWIGEVAPHLITPEEAFWAALCIAEKILVVRK